MISDLSAFQLLNWTIPERLPTNLSTLNFFFSEDFWIQSPSSNARPKIRQIKAMENAGLVKDKAT